MMLSCSAGATRCAMPEYGLTIRCPFIHIRDRRTTANSGVNQMTTPGNARMTTICACSIASATCRNSVRFRSASWNARCSDEFEARHSYPDDDRHCRWGLDLFGDTGARAWRRRVPCPRGDARAGAYTGTTCPDLGISRPVVDGN